MQEIHFRKAGVKDCERLAELVNSAYRGDSSRQGWTTEADLLGGQRTDAESLGVSLESEENVIFVAEIQSELMGCVFLQRKDRKAYLGMLTVRPKQQARGLGRQILQFAENWAVKTWRSEAIEMTVIDRRQELISWYERRGYVLTDRRESFPMHDRKFGEPIVTDLEFVVLEKRITAPHQDLSQPT